MPLPAGRKAVVDRVADSALVQSAAVECIAAAAERISAAESAVAEGVGTWVGVVLPAAGSRSAGAAVGSAACNRCLPIASADPLIQAIDRRIAGFSATLKKMD